MQQLSYACGMNLLSTHSQRYSPRCENAGRGSVFEFASIKRQEKLVFLVFYA